MLKISKIPEDIKKNLIIKKIESEEFISYGKNEKIGYLIAGEVQGVRYHDGKRLLFPDIYKKGDFVGLIPALLNNNFDFELETKKDSVVLEIPKSIFKKYLLSNSKTEIELLKNISVNLLHSTRSFFIRIHGGPRAYFAYLLYLYTQENTVVTFDSYLEIGEMVFSSKITLHKILKEFEKENLVEKAPKVLIIKNRRKLKSYFEKYIDL